MALAIEDFDFIQPKMSREEADSRFQDAADTLLRAEGIRVLAPTSDIRHSASLALQSAGITGGQHIVLDEVTEIAAQKYILVEGEIR